MSTAEYFFLKIQSDRKNVNCFTGPPSSVSNASHLSFSDLKKVASSVFWIIININKKTCLSHLFFIKVA